VRGAFTGAIRDHPGLFMAARGGTLLLDEIGDVSPAMQHRLLRVLQERELTPVGGIMPTKVDVRVIAATNRDLRAEVASGHFREDLYYRLKVFQIELPPLRTRRGDIPLLVRDWLSKRAGDALGCSPFAMRLLQSYDWPGNVRELIGVLESAHVRAAGGRIEAQHLPEEIRAGQSMRAPGSPPVDLDPVAEASAIRAALQASGCIRARAAEMLGMGRTTLWRKLKEHGIGQDGLPS
jgi:two-component system, NtrC family, response regulator HydG